MESVEQIKAVPNALKNYLKNIPKAALAFSGGVDSSYLLYAAKACGVDVHAYYVHAQFQPEFELNDAKRLVKELEANMTVLPVDVLANEMVKNNPTDRCYYCKRLIFKTILNQAITDGYTVLMDGSNASDDTNDRPGMRALVELQVLSPLREAGMTKQQVRDYSKKAELFTWDKPAYACLATRIPTGTPISNELLEKIEKAENVLSQMGFTDFRARVLGDIAKLQLPAQQIPIAAQKHTELVEALSPWFNDVLLDLKPR
ncbi:MAG: ATP-dependent sacrificial sulfur transferase LarE [Clostridiaceae bacterium]|nr:ATP-dependent sacrificial sulfur transferase LarE [Clostridiaceae bacterium]